MKKTRAPKGKYYWWIYLDNLNAHCSQDTTQDDYDRQSDIRYETGNYFNSFFEAVSVAKKIRAVLAGADVIEMPSEEEIESVASKICHEIEKCGIVSGHPISGYITSACKSMADFFNNKIVK